jgi:hypothetical protein
VKTPRGAYGTPLDLAQNSGPDSACDDAAMLQAHRPSRSRAGRGHYTTESHRNEKSDFLEADRSRVHMMETSVYSGICHAGNLLGCGRFFWVQPLPKRESIAQREQLLVCLFD